MRLAGTDPFIIALDFATAAEARSLVEALDGAVSFYKVGLELYTASGPEFVKELIAAGKRVFLDLKFYDIAETVKRAVARAAALEATLLTVHGSPAVMRAAVEGRSGSSLKLCAVTVLTSFDDRDLQEFGYTATVRELSAFVTRTAMECGVDGLIGSALEAASIRAQAGSNPILVTPGVRSPGAARSDQKRVATPAEAIHNGADYVVIGRQVTRAADPRAAVEAVRSETAVHDRD